MSSGGGDEASWPFEMGGMEAGAMVLVFVVSVMANSAGVGGGVIFNPVMSAMLGFSVQMAAGLSQSIITLGSLATVWTCLLSHHPLHHGKPVADLEIALLAAPTLLLGVSVGVLGNQVLPSWLTTFLLILLLLLVCLKTLFSGLRMWRKEKAAAAAQSPAAKGAGGPATAACGMLQNGEEAAEEGMAAAAEAGKGVHKPGTAVCAVGDGPEPGIPAYSGGPGVAPASSPFAAVQADGSQNGSLPAFAVEVSAAAAAASAAGHADAGEGTPLARVSRLSSAGSGNTWQEAGAAMAEALRLLAMDRCSTPGDQPASLLEVDATGYVHAHHGFTSRPSTAGSQQQQWGAGSRRSSSFVSLELGFVPGSGSNSRRPSASSASLSAAAAVTAVAMTPTAAHHHQQQQQQAAGVPGEALTNGQAAGEQRAQAEHAGKAVREQGAVGTGADPRRFPEVPWKPLCLLIGVLGAYIGIQLAKVKLGSCTPAWQALWGVQVLVFGGCAALLVVRAARKAAHRRAQRVGGRGSSPAVQAAAQAAAADASRVGEAEEKGQAQGQGQAAEADTADMSRWTTGRLMGVSLLFMLGGLIAGLFGVGGGIVAVPLLLQLGLHPQAAAATSSVLVLMSCLTGALSYLVVGNLNLQYAGVYGACSFFGGLLGVLVVGMLVRRSGHPSIVVLVLALVIGAGAVMTAAVDGRQSVENLINGENVGFNSLCTSSSS